MRARPKWGPSHQEAFRGKKKPVHQSEPVLCWHYLSSRAVARKVLSAQMSLTSVFGMGTGGPSPQSTPTREEGLPLLYVEGPWASTLGYFNTAPGICQALFFFFSAVRSFCPSLRRGRDRWFRPFPGIARQCAYRRGNPYSLRQGVAERNFSRRIQKALWFSPAKRSCHADRQQVSACHCEERSDGTIRNSCGRA